MHSSKATLMKKVLDEVKRYGKSRVLIVHMMTCLLKRQLNSFLKIRLGLKIGLQINIQDAPQPPPVKTEFIFYLITVVRGAVSTCSICFLGHGSQHKSHFYNCPLLISPRP